MRTPITILSLAAALSACQPHYDGLEIQYLSSDGSVSKNGRIEIEHGDAVIIEVTPISDNPYEDYEAFDLVTLESFNTTVLEISPLADVDKFALIGKGVGETTVRILVNDREEDQVQAEVQPQEGP
ncbi:MAG TPA: hypothetical protein VG755_12900 [Nannocystaceae bacterium]|nr:hypothetical protein [Nannocystaceae bacterium]